MRPTKHSKIQKSGTRAKISKKKYMRKYRSWRFNNDVSIANLENINEVLRINKSHRAEGRGSWKLVPKDSCEVYKERRRKQMQSKEQHSDESLTEDSRKRSRRDKRQKEVDKRVKKKPIKNTRKNRRPRSDSSLPSRTSCSSMSTSCASTSDMEY